MLTPEQVAEGRRCFERRRDDFSLEAWLAKHAEALIDAADRVARDASRPTLDFFGRELTQEELDREAQLLLAASRAAAAERARATARYRELEPDLVREFRTRHLVHDDNHATNPRAFKPKHVRAWLHARGVQATVIIDPANPRALLVDPLRVLFDDASPNSEALERWPDSVSGTVWPAARTEDASAETSHADRVRSQHDAVHAATQGKDTT